MSFDAPRWRFTGSMIEDAPDWKGVYVLWSGATPLAVGHARGGNDTIRSRLLAHRSHIEAGGLRQVTHYSWEICADPLKREAQIVRELGLERRESRPEQTAVAASNEAPWNALESS